MRILILGSCVTRDAFELQPELLPTTVYFARSALVSAVSDRVVEGVNLDLIKSNFQRKTVKTDITKTFVNFLKKNEFDCFIYDLIDERLDLLFDPAKNTFATFSPALRMTGYQKKKELRRIPFGTEKFFQLWEKSWCKLVRILDETDALGKFRLNKVYWSLKTELSCDFSPNFSEENILLANEFLNRMYQRIEKDICASQIFKFDSGLFVGSDVHKWGLAPFHYVPEYYEKLIMQISNINLANHLPVGSRQA